MGILRLAAGAIALLGLAGGTRAEKAPSSTEELARSATLIVEGTVQAVHADRELDWPWEYLRLHAVVKIQGVVKGEGFSVGDMIGCRYWIKSWKLPTPPPPDTSGHWPLPRSGQVVRVYVVEQGYNGFGQTTDGGYDVFGRNGWVIMSSPPGAAENDAIYDSLNSDWRRSAYAVVGLVTAFLVVAWFLWRRRRSHVRHQA